MERDSQEQPIDAHLAPQPPRQDDSVAFIDAEELPSPASEQAEQDTSLAEQLYLLLAGAALEVSGLTQAWLRGKNPADQPPPSDWTLGLVGAGLGAVRTAVSLSQWSLNVARFSGKVAWLMLPNAVAVRLERRRSRLVALGETAVPQAQQESQRIAALIIDNIVQLVAASPAVRTLVEEQVQLALPHLLKNEAVDALVTEQVTRLTQEPEVQKLVQQQAGQYLDYLEQNSDQIERLVQGQSVGLAGEVLDEVREQMVTADALVERVVRRLFGRRRRSTPLPPIAGNQP